MTTEEIAAQLEIRDLIARYNQTGDANDVGGFAGTFAENGAIEGIGYSFAGREAILAWKVSRTPGAGSVPVGGPLFRRHNVTTTRITLDGPDRASGLVYWMVISELGLDHTGFYTDRYVREGGEWLIGHRLVTIIWRHEHSMVSPDQIAPEFVPPPKG